MKPKKYKENIPKVAEDNGLDVLCTRDIVDFYWKEVRKSVSGLSNPRVQVHSLGYFQIYKTRLKKKIADISRFFLLPPEKMTFQKHAFIEGMIKNRELTNKVQAIIDSDTEKLKIIKDIKYGRIAKTDLEKPEKHTGRYFEQLIKEARSRKNSAGQNGDMQDLPSD